MKTHHVLLATLFSFLFIAGVGACRHGHHRGGFDEFDREAAASRIASRLALTDSQKTELKDIFDDLAARAKEMRADIEARHQEIADLVRQDAIAPETVDLMITEKIDRMRELADHAASRLIAFHASLSPEQREKVAEHIEKRGLGGRGFFRP